MLNSSHPRVYARYARWPLPGSRPRMAPTVGLRIPIAAISCPMFSVRVLAFFSYPYSKQ